MPKLTSGKLIVAFMVTALIMSVFAASAFNVLTLSRSATIDVVNDANGIITLTPGASPIVVQDSDGALSIDSTLAGASGLNVDSVLEIGDNSSQANAASDPGFTITNNGNGAYDLDLNYTVADGTGEADGRDNVNFVVYDGASVVGTVTEDNSLQVTNANFGSGTSLYVVVVIDTQDMTASADDLSGTFTLEATSP